MKHAIRTLLLFLCMILFAASGVLLHAAPIKKLPDEPEESAVEKSSGKEQEKASAEAEESTKPAEAKPAKTEDETIKEITERLDRMIYPYKPLQRTREPILNRDLSDEVVPSWRLIYVKPFDKPQDEAGTGTSAATAPVAEDDDEDLKEDFAAITLIPVKSIRLSNALKLGTVERF